MTHQAGYLQLNLFKKEAEMLEVMAMLVCVLQKRNSRKHCICGGNIWQSIVKKHTHLLIVCISHHPLWQVVFQYSWHIVVFFAPVGHVLVFVQGEVNRSTVQTNVICKNIDCQALVFIFNVAWYQPCCQM